MFIDGKFKKDSRNEAQNLQRGKGESRKYVTVTMAELGGGRVTGNVTSMFYISLKSST